MYISHLTYRDTGTGNAAVFGAVGGALAMVLMVTIVLIVVVPVVMIVTKRRKPNVKDITEKRHNNTIIMHRIMT